MSHALGLATITATLKDALENALSSAAGLGDARVSLLPPDRIETGADEHSQLNLFLYRVAPRSTLAATPGNGAAGIAIELFYLLTAYGSGDYVAEVLLGHALQAILGRPTLETKDLERSLKSIGGPAKSALRKAVAPDQPLTVTPHFLSMDDMSKLWSSLQAKYRPSLALHVAPLRMASHV